MAIITFFGGSYCHKEEIIKKVIDRLKFENLTDKLFDETASRFEVERDKLHKALHGPEPFMNKITHEREKNIARLKIVLSELIRQDEIALEGCAGHLIPKTIAHVLRVCIIANQDYRIEQAVKETGENEKKAGRIIRDDDKRNFDCTDYLLRKPPYFKDLYDMVISTHDTSVDEAVEAICRYAESDPVRTTDRSKRAAQDFALSARVEMALAEEGLSAQVHSEEGQVVLSINENVVRLQHHREKLAEAARKVPGVKDVTTRRGPKFRASSVNPWANIEGPPRFMLVDDEKEYVNTLSERLRTRNLESSIAYDGEQALEMAQEDAPDVMVLDLMMPGINGIEVLRRMRRDHPHVKVIILTGHGSDREKQEAEELGAFAYLQKPVDIDVLARVMKDAYSSISREQDGEED